MSTYKNEEISINFKDLFFTLLKKIFVMLIVGALIGGVLGGKKVIQRVKTNDVLDASMKLNESETSVQYELRVQNINRARVYVDMIANVNRQIDHQRTYISDSLYMQIDAENTFQTTAQITLTLKNNDFSGLDAALFGAYEREIKAGDYLDEYAKDINTKPDYIKELISFSSSNPNNPIVSIDSDLNTIGSMYINVYGPSEKFCDDVLNLIINEVNSVYGELNSSVAQHEISVVGIQHICKIDNGIRDSQINQIGKIDTLQKQIASYNDSLDKVAAELGVDSKEDLLEYFEVHEEVEVNGIPTTTSEKNVSRWSMIKPGIKLGILGFAGGVFIVVLFYCIKYLFGKRFTNQAQFFNKFSGIRKIGVMKPVGKRTKYAKFIDRLSEDDLGLSTDNTNKLIGINMENLAGDLKRVLITGTGNEEVAKKAIKSLSIKADYKPDMFKNPDVLRSVSDYEGIVLLEERNSSKYKNIDREIELIANSGVPIIGAIII